MERQKEINNQINLYNHFGQQSQHDQYDLLSEPEIKPTQHINQNQIFSPEYQKTKSLQTQVIYRNIDENIELQITNEKKFICVTVIQNVQMKKDDLQRQLGNTICLNKNNLNGERGNLKANHLIDHKNFSQRQMINKTNVYRKKVSNNEMDQFMKGIFYDINSLFVHLKQTKDIQFNVINNQKLITIISCEDDLPSLSQQQILVKKQQLAEQQEKQYYLNFYVDQVLPDGRLVRRFCAIKLNKIILQPGDLQILRIRKCKHMQLIVDKLYKEINHFKQNLKQKQKELNKQKQKNLRLRSKMKIKKQIQNKFIQKKNQKLSQHQNPETQQKNSSKKGKKKAIKQNKKNQKEKQRQIKNKITQFEKIAHLQVLKGEMPKFDVGMEKQIQVKIEKEKIQNNFQCVQNKSKNSNKNDKKYELVQLQDSDPIISQNNFQKQSSEESGQNQQNKVRKINNNIKKQISLEIIEESKQQKNKNLYQISQNNGPKLNWITKQEGRQSNYRKKLNQSQKYRDQFLHECSQGSKEQQQEKKDFYTEKQITNKNDIKNNMKEKRRQFQIQVKENSVKQREKLPINKYRSFQRQIKNEDLNNSSLYIKSKQVKRDSKNQEENIRKFNKFDLGSEIDQKINKFYKFRILTEKNIIEDQILSKNWYLSADSYLSLSQQIEAIDTPCNQLTLHFYSKISYIFVEVNQIYSLGYYLFYIFLANINTTKKAFKQDLVIMSYMQYCKLLTEIQFLAKSLKQNKNITQHTKQLIIQHNHILGEYRQQYDLLINVINKDLQKIRRITIRCPNNKKNCDKQSHWTSYLKHQIKTLFRSNYKHS